MGVIGLRILEDLVSSCGLVLGGISANLTHDDRYGVVFSATVAQLAQLLLDLGQPQVAGLPAELLHLLNDDVLFFVIVVVADIFIDHRPLLLLRLNE